MKPRGLKIAAVLALSLLGMGLLPLLALPYGNLDWLAYDPAYHGSYSSPPTSLPTPHPPEIPCAELPEPGKPLAAQVNGQSIGLATFEREVAQFLDALLSLGNDPDSAEFQAQIPAVRRQVLDLLIDDVLVQQAAIELGLTVTEEDIQTEVAAAVAESGGLEPLQAWLEDTGQTWQEFSRDVCQDLLRQAVLERVTAGLGGTMEMVRARQIVVATEAEAVAALARLASGEPFEDVARQVSLDDQSRDQGGDLGWFPPGFGLVPNEIEAAVLAAAPGQVQGPLQVAETYTLVQAIESQSDHPLEPDTQAQLQVIVFERWLAQQREAAEIEIWVDLAAQPRPSVSARRPG